MINLEALFWRVLIGHCGLLRPKISTSRLSNE
jgi:hypothetical protein